jgi:hypothetical protein
MEPLRDRTVYQCSRCTDISSCSRIVLAASVAHPGVMVGVGFKDSLRLGKLVLGVL